MTKKRYRSKSQVNQDHFNQKAIKEHRDEKYKRAYKGATKEYADNRKNGVDGLLGNGARAIADRLNTAYLTSPNDRQLKKVRHPPSRCLPQGVWCISSQAWSTDQSRGGNHGPIVSPRSNDAGVGSRGG